MRNTRNKEYHRLLSSSRWRRLRQSFLRKHPLCEECERNNRTKLAKVVHHIIPVEDAKSAAQMELLAYDASNLEALCEECHELRHVELGSSKKKGKRAVRTEAQKIASDVLKFYCNIESPEQ